MTRHTAERRWRSMNNETHPALVNYNPGQASLLEMRADPNRFPRLKSLPRDVAVFEMSKIVSQAFLYKGQTADPTNIQFIASALVSELMEDRKCGASSLSLAEIQVVVKRAVLATDMIGISVASLYRIIMDYVKGEGHLNQKKVDQMARREESVPTIIKAYAGQMIRNNKI